MVFLFQFLFRNLKGYRWLVVIALLISIAEVICTLGAAFPVKFITSKVGSLGNDPACTFTFLGTDYQQGVLGLFDNPAIDPSLKLGPAAQTECPATPGDQQSILHPILTQHSQIGVIVFSVVLLLVLSIFSAILGYFDLYIATYIAQNLSARLRTSLFEHLQRLSLDWHGKQKKGDLIQRITANIADIEKLVTDGLVDLLVGGFTLAGVLIIMLAISWQYTLLTLAIAPFLFAITVYYTRGIKAATKKAAKEAGRVAEVATEDINALTVIKVFTREELEDMRFGKRVVQTRQAGLLAGFLQAQFAPLVGILLSLGTAVVVGVGGYVAAGNPVDLGVFSLLGGSVDVGTLVLFLLFLNVLFQPMKDLAKLNNLMNVASAGAERIQEVLDQAPEVIETTTPYYGPQRLKGDISFEHVVFSYSPERPVLKDINLHIPAGKRVALVGLSGGGKTTLVKLISRFYEIQQGSVKIDGVDNRAYPLNVLRNNISMVLQDSVLFEGTIRDNIALGRPDATEADIIDAARKAHMHETIMSWPDQYNTLVREQGRNFSGGQRQRIAIARAILRDAPILILDEPTAALDVEAEAEVMRALDTLIIGRTVIVISHRLSTLGRVDQIIVLGEGRILEQGTYKELKRKNGVFAGLLDEQNRYSADQLSSDSVIISAFTPRPHDLDFDPPLPPRPTPSMHGIPPSPTPAFNNNPVSGHGIPPSPTPAFNNNPASGHGIPPSPTPAFNNNPISGHGIPPTPPPASKNNPVSNHGIADIPPSNGSGSGQSMQRARIVIEVDGKVAGTRQLDKPVMTIGRLSSNDVQVPSQRVSRMHARIRWERNSWYIEDAESLNGIVFEGNRISQHELRHGDQIALAPQTFVRYEIL